MKQRTYSHLEHLQRRPTDYEVTTTNLLYYPARGFAVKVPAEQWYQAYQRGSLLRSGDWEGFADPRATTYARYVALMHEKEIVVESLLSSIEPDYDRGLSEAWMTRLERVLPPLRYPTHGLQMAAAYVGQMAPSGRVVVACAFQAADELRRVHFFAYRMRQLQHSHAAFGAPAKNVWLGDRMWQPLRALIERLLVTYDFGEALVLLNLVVKPLYDELFFRQFAQLALAHGDHILERALHSMYEDGVWHREWVAALLRHVFSDRPENRGVVERWVSRHYSTALGAMAEFAPLFAGPAGADSAKQQDVVAAIDAKARSFLSGLELRVP
jgi:toluene monooxygenase system protein E